MRMTISQVEALEHAAYEAVMDLISGRRSQKKARAAAAAIRIWKETCLEAGYRVPDRWWSCYEVA